ncbi:hypothetical protein D9M72_407600 [compost metagenome]
MQLRVLALQPETLHQVERVVRSQAGHVEVLGEHQHHQYQHRPHHHARRHRAGHGARGLALARALRQLARIPAADAPQHHHAHQRRQREPRQAGLLVHDQRGQQRPHGAAAVAAHLEDRLRQPVLAARGHARHARRLGVEDRRPRADQRSGHQQHAVARRHRQQQQARQRERHGDGQRMRLGMLVGVQAHHRLQQRRRDLVGHGQQANLGEAQVEAPLEHRIDRQDQRLDHVVEEVGEADRGQHAEAGAFGLCGRGGRAGS